MDSIVDGHLVGDRRAGWDRRRRAFDPELKQPVRCGFQGPVPTDRLCCGIPLQIADNAPWNERQRWRVDEIDWGGVASSVSQRESVENGLRVAYH